MNKYAYIILFICSTSLLFSQNEKLIKAFTALDYRDTNLAIYLFNEVNQLNYEKKLVLNELSQIYLAQKKYNDAIRTNLELLHFDSTASFKLALSYAYKQQADSTIYWLKQYLLLKNKMPENKIRTHNAFAFLFKNKNWEELWRHQWFDEYEARLAEIEYLFDKQEINDLIDLIEKSLTIYQNDTRLILWRARAYLAGKNTKEALKSIQLILKIDPRHYEASIVKVQILDTQKKYKELAKTYLQLYDIQPYRICWLWYAAANFNLAYDFTRALETTKRYLLHDTLSDKIYYEAGIAAKNLKRYNEAITFFTHAIELNSGFSELYYERGVCYYETQQYELAFNDLCMAMDLKAMQGKYFYQRGLIYYAMKNALAACRDFERAKQLGYIKAETYIQRYCKGK